jgi:undecaprenyl-diphosphatase
LAYAGLALLIVAQAAGAPLPAETALIAAAVLASRGQLDIVAVLLVTVGAAIAGGFLGYALGRAVGRSVVARLATRAVRLAALVDAGERFFGRHGSKAVFLARWVSGVRIVAAPLAGLHAMRQRTFALWNVAGGILWPLTIGGAAYALGRRVALLVGAGVLAAALALLIARRRRRRVS